MADIFTTTADLLQLGDGNISDIDVSELLEGTPVLASLFAQQASYETTHEWIKKTVAPVVGFREINDGRENDKATYAKITRDLELFDASFAIDQGLLQSKSGERLRTREARDHLSAAFVDLEKQIIYGTGASATGFAGWADETSVDALADLMVIDGGGTTVATGSSVWAYRTNMESVSVVYGLDAMISIGQEYPTTLAGSTTGIYDAMRTPMLFYSAVQVATTLDLARIANLTEDSTGLLDDDKISLLLASFPANKGPNFMAMNRRSWQQLQDSRTATNVTGAPAPFPNESFGVPIVVTDQINSTEALLV